MNSPFLQLPSNQPVHTQNEKQDALDIRKFVDLFIDQRWLIAAIALIVTLLGIAYAFMATPIYQSTILIQVEDQGDAPKNIPGDLSTAFELKTAAASEIEVLRSRRVLVPAVESTQYFIEAGPRYFPGIGAWIARMNKEISDPGFFSYGGYAWGAEKIEVTRFDVPESLEGKTFVVTAGSGGSFRVANKDEGIEIDGQTGSAVNASTAHGTIELYVARLDGKPGTQFLLTRSPRIVTIEKLQEKLSISERGRQSGVISVALEGSDRLRTTRILQEIGREYMHQNEARKSDAAERSLAVLEGQLPGLKREVEQSEARYNEARNKYGSVDLGEEARGLIQQVVFAQNKMLELSQKKEEHLGRFAEAHPLVQTTTQQIRSLNRDIETLNAKIKRLPIIEQEIVRLRRDVEVNNSVYTSALSRAQQLRLATATKAGNVRLLDSPEKPVAPVKPRRPIVISLAAVLGLALGMAAAFIRKKFSGRIDYADEIEDQLGFPVTWSIPLGGSQRLGLAAVQGQKKDTLLLPHEAPGDSVIESLHGLRAILQVTNSDRKNNVILITGPTPNVGKSFVSANFATVLASVGKKVLLIDGDMRTGHLHRYFNCDRKYGLSNALAGEAELHRIVRKDVVQNVDFISTGDCLFNPAELLARGNLEKLLQFFTERYDFVLIDTAPLLLVSDALEVAPYASTTFNVVRSGINTESEVEETVRRLVQATKKTPFIVFNGAKQRSAHYGYGGYYGTHPAQNGTTKFRVAKIGPT